MAAASSGESSYDVSVVLVAYAGYLAVEAPKKEYRSITGSPPVIHADENEEDVSDGAGFVPSARLLAEVTSASSGFSERHAATRASLLFAVGFESGAEEMVCLILRRGPRFRRPTGPSGPFDLRLPSRSRHVGSSLAGSGTPRRVAGATVDARRGAARRPPGAGGDVAGARTHAVADRTADAIARWRCEVRVIH